MNVLVINCGSSSLKFQLIETKTEAVIAKGICERIGIDGGKLVYSPANGSKQVTELEMPSHEEAISAIIKALTDSKIGVISDLSEIDAVGHRLVHGGEEFASSTIITEDVMEVIRECSVLAPLHNPANIIGIEACQKLMPTTPMVGVFDTAFHQSIPEIAYLYAIPYSYYEKYKIRKYGFHGTSHDYVSRKVAEVLGEEFESLKIIVCHLGNGASITAIKNGKSIDTSMGLTPLEGLIMGTRSGDVDPGVVEFIANKENKTIGEVISILNKESGMLGLTNGFSSDFRDIENGYIEGNEICIRAYRAFSYRVAKYIGSYVAAMNGVDVICFTAGVGENGPIIRDIVCGEYLGYLGIELDQEANLKRGEDIIITKEGCKTKVAVIPTNEELVIARETYALVK